MPQAVVFYWTHFRVPWRRRKSSTGSLPKEIQLDAVLSDDLSIEEVVTRLSGRRTCAQCKAVFHVIGRPPKQAGVCDVLNQTIPISSCSAYGQKRRSKPH